jgi:hypothetical protein
MQLDLLYMQKTFISDACKYFIWNSIVNIGLTKKMVYDVLVRKNYDKYVLMNELSYDPDDDDFSTNEVEVLQEFNVDPDSTSTPTSTSTSTNIRSRTVVSNSDVDIKNRVEASLQISLKNLQNVPNDKDTEIYMYKNVMTEQDRLYLIEEIRSHALDSTVLKGGQSVLDKSSRTSKTHYFYNDTVANNVLKKIIDDLQLVSTAVEGVQGASYDKDCYYHEHYDFLFDLDNIKSKGQRNWTILVYLNDDFEGGETKFVPSNTLVKPVKNTAVVWNNIKNNKVNYDTLHEALPVNQGVKYVLQIWIRNK